MFKKKYMFETGRARFGRNLKNLLLLGSGALFLLIFSLAFYLFQETKNLPSLNRALDQQMPDLIVVFTGAAGRISKAIEVSKKIGHVPVFVTGVYSKKAIANLMKSLDRELRNKFHVDYLAKNTVENVLSTTRFLSEHPQLKKILIISHDYHIRRIRLIVSRFSKRNQERSFSYYGLPSDFKQWRNLRILFKEVFKIMNTYFFLSLWGPEKPV